MEQERTFTQEQSQAMYAAMKRLLNSKDLIPVPMTGIRPEGVEFLGAWYQLEETLLNIDSAPQAESKRYCEKHGDELQKRLDGTYPSKAKSERYALAEGTRNDWCVLDRTISHPDYPVVGIYATKAEAIAEKDRLNGDK
jgi:hypothetical protein